MADWLDEVYDWATGSGGIGTFLGGLFGGPMGMLGMGIGSLFWGSDDMGADAPEMGKEERENIEKMEEQVEEQQNFYEQMMPLIAHELHFDVKYDKWTGEPRWQKMSDDEWYNSEKTTDDQRRQWDMYLDSQELQNERRDLYREEMDRYGKAMRGELEIPKGLLDVKNEEFETLKNSSGIMGESPDKAVAEDTIAIQRLNAFNKRWDLAEDRARFGEIGRGSQAMTLQQLSGEPGNDYGPLMGLNQDSRQQLGSQIGGLSSILQPYQHYTDLGYQNDLFNTQMNYQLLGDLLNLAGTGAGAAVGKR